jgi:hypothetical protein
VRQRRNEQEEEKTTQEKRAFRRLKNKSDVDPEKQSNWY